MKTQKAAEVKNKNEKTAKTAIIYCRAANMKFAKQQQAEAETRAKELNAIVEAVFIDIKATQPKCKQILWLRFMRFFKKGQTKKANKRVEWRNAMSYLRKHITDYVITQCPDRITRDYAEFRRIKDNITGLGTRLAYCTDKQEEEDIDEAFLCDLYKALRRHPFA